ncbi:UDP-N-acetylglucosamine 2-epimerase (non-hydrolyzing) [bacterium]|nr:UDP-N-acetylglucosamine 2-epimerase (non-hydrolyzing) [bacterium]
MKKLKILTVVGTRPEIIRLSRVIAKMDEFCSHTLVHTGQNYDYGLSQVFFDDLDIPAPDYFLGAAGGSPAEAIGNMIIAFDKVLDVEKPDAVLVLGDTNSCLSVIAAKRKKIPIFHMEAGNRCFDMRVPEEINRRVVDHISDVNLTYSKIARDYLIAEGLPPDLVIKTGSPMAEVLHHYKNEVNSSTVMDDLNLQPHEFFIISVHREENVADEIVFGRFLELINVIAEYYNLPIIVSTHPRIKNKVNDQKSKINRLVNFHEPFGFFDYVQLQVNARAVLSDSGTITEESSILNFPAVNLREAHERPEGMEEGAVMMVGFNCERVMQALSILDAQKNLGAATLNPVADYEAKNVSEKVLRIIHSYTDYVNRIIWRKY